MARLEDRLTQVSPREVFDALGVAWQQKFAAPAHRTSVLVLVAQWALETGRGESMHCFNLGNVKSRQERGDWCFFRCNELLSGRVVWFDPDHPACCFRAFGSLGDGSADYLETLYGRFRLAWPAVLAGDPATFSHSLKLQKYYTANEAQYTKTLVSLFKEFSRTIPRESQPEGEGEPLPDLYSTRGLQTALVGLGFDPGVLDGINGPNTTAAVHHFQATHGLVPDGIIGRLTRGALARAWLSRGSG